MVQKQKEDIIHMRNDGFSYSKIASALSISENTVKSFCRRNNLGGATNCDSAERCLKCGSSLSQTKGAKQKRFCSEECRVKWWNAHPEAVNKKAFYKITCLACGMEFNSYGNKNRKYCSRSCFGVARRATYE